ALTRLADRVGYQTASLLLADPGNGVLHRYRKIGACTSASSLAGAELPLDAEAGAIALTDLPILANALATELEPIRLALARAHHARSLVAAPLRVREQILGVLTVTSMEPGRFDQGDLDLLVAVANHVALAIDRAQSFRTIEELSRGLEDKV